MRMHAACQALCSRGSYRVATGLMHLTLNELSIGLAVDPLIRTCPHLPIHHYCNFADWSLDAECQGNSLWICGTFSSDDEATTFNNDFTTYAGQDNAVVFEGVAGDDFCSTYPGSTITIQTYDYPGKYDKTWGSGSSYTWNDNTCSINVNMTYTCPEVHAPPPSDQPTSTPTCDVVSLPAQCFAVPGRWQLPYCLVPEAFGALRARGSVGHACAMTTTKLVKQRHIDWSACCGT